MVNKSEWEQSQVYGDAVSRQAVLDVIEREQFKGDAISEIEKLPTAAIPYDDCISRSKTIADIKEFFRMGDCYCDEYSIVGCINGQPSVAIRR